MKTWIKSLICISLSFMCLFTCFGYAAISGQLAISGTAISELKEPEGIYISKVSVHAENGAEVEKHDISFPTNLKSTVKVDSKNASVTFEITVYNKTEMTYWYLGVKSLENYDSNDLINKESGIFIYTKDTSASNSSSFDDSDWVPPKTERVFYATYTFGNNAQGTISTMVNFSFGLNMDGISDEFLKVLNDKNSDFGYQYLANAFDQKYKDDNSTVLGNVGEDVDVFNNIFGSDLSIMVDGKEMPVTIMVERKNLDKNSNSGDAYTTGSPPLSGCEYTVYITVDNLDSPNSQATVYAISYTCGADGTWYQLGELYEGKCTVKDYDATDDTYTGAFNVGSWIAVTKEYWITDKISYRVAYNGHSGEKLYTMQELLSVNDDNFYNAINNNSSSLLIPVCKILYSYVSTNGKYVEYVNTSNMHNPGYEALREAFEVLKPYCFIEGAAQNVRIANARSLTRAQLIPLLERINQAYEYYKSVNK